MELEEKYWKVENCLKDVREKLILIKDIGFDYDGFRTPGNLMRLIDELISYDKDAIKMIDKTIKDINLDK